METGEKISFVSARFLFSVWYNKGKGGDELMSASPEQRLRHLQREIARLDDSLAQDQARLARAEMAALRERQRERKSRNHRLFVLGAELLAMFPDLIEVDDDQARKFVHDLVQRGEKS